MDDSATVTLSLTADAPVRVWLKTVTPALVLRCKEKALDTYVVTNSAANVESGDSRTVRLRFDGSPVATESWSESTDRMALFAPAPEQFLDRLRTTSRFLLQYVPFNASPVVISFSTRGLSSHAQKLITACPEATKTQAQRRAEREAEEAPRRAAMEAERKRTDPQTQDIVGVTAAQVKEALGEPHFIDGDRWTFDRINGLLLTVLFKDGKVTEVSPAGLSYRSIIRHEDPPIMGPAPNITTPAPPAAVARCGDGQFVFTSTGDKTCEGHGGVLQWLKKH